jgi:DNA-directed RNA polymerase II subunit RPB2
MPFTKEGIKPDMIINPHGFMSRMSCSQIIEMAVGKLCLKNAVLGDGTPFEDYDVSNLDTILEQNGFNRAGTEKLINGETGEEIACEIFIGPCYYQRLKHITEDKIHARSRGPRTTLTRQPTEGRSRDGGSRIGEMERDAIIALNCSKFLQEKMMNNSDAFIMYICGDCGAPAQRYIDDERNKNLEPYPTIYDIHECSLCRNKTNIKKIRLPYACKLLFQELTSMNILPSIKTD